jgi:hypothetical protein
LREPARRERGDLIVFFIPRLDAVPAQSIIQREILLQAPAILDEPHVLVAAVERLKLVLVVLAVLYQGESASELQLTYQCPDGGESLNKRTERGMYNIVDSSHVVSRLHHIAGFASHNHGGGR